LVSSKKFIENEIKTKIINWTDVYKYISKEHQINNGNIVNQIKPLLVAEGYQFMFFPMMQFIIKD
jgi:hypothetical protein